MMGAKQTKNHGHEHANKIINYLETLPSKNFLPIGEPVKSLVNPGFTMKYYESKGPFGKGREMINLEFTYTVHKNPELNSLMIHGIPKVRRNLELLVGISLTQPIDSQKRGN